MYFVENAEKIRVNPAFIVDSLKPRSENFLCFIIALEGIGLYLSALNLQVEFRIARDGATDIRSNTTSETITDQQRSI